MGLLTMHYMAPLFYNSDDMFSYYVRYKGHVCDVLFLTTCNDTITKKIKISIEGTHMKNIMLTICYNDIIIEGKVATYLRVQHVFRGALAN